MTLGSGNTDSGSVDSVPSVTECLLLTEETQQRARLLSAYSHTVERLEQEQEEGARKDDDGEDSNSEKFAANDKEDAPGCYGCLQQLSQKMDDSLVHCKVLYIFMRGGEACLSLYLSVYGLQVGFNPLQLGFIFALPRLISFFTTPLVGYIADKFKCRKEMLLFALCLWVFFSLMTNFIPAPKLASCALAARQLQQSIAKVNLTKMSRPTSWMSNPSHYVMSGYSRNFGQTSDTCMISDNVTTKGYDVRPSWLNVLHVTSTLWSERAEKCYPGGKFWGSITVPVGTSVQGPSATFQGWMYEYESLIGSFYAVFALITVANVMQCTTMSLTDTATVHSLGPGRSREYGWQRAFGNAGYAIYIILVTTFINLSSTKWSHCTVDIVVEDYRIAFVIFLGTTSCAIALLSAYCIKFTHKDPSETNLLNLRRVFGRARPGLIVMVLWYLAANEGAITIFLPFHLSTQGAPQRWVKASRIISGISELSFAFHLGGLIKNRGHEFLLIAGTAGYLICFLAYALVPRPPGIIAFEVIHGMSRALTWNVVVPRMSSEVHPENLASLLGCLSGVFYLGQGVGAVIAGVCVSVYGAPVTFFSCALLSFIIAVVMLIVYQANEKTRKKNTKSQEPVKYSLLSETETDDP
ncbi:major facilitator superfamily domain-containing protein 6-like [Diadema antillarum]|uniref:major facilitator superfamily domain-containing protein 6-like n=1 Tax=Diadema antillarum TaxID=105358 RepID=UPI003A84CFE5